MSSSQFVESDSEFTPYRGTLTSFGAEDDDKVVKRSPFTLQGNAGAGWVTLDSDWYYVWRSSGWVQFRDTDDDGNDVDISAYIQWQEDGNVAFRATYTVKDGTSSATYTNESMTFADVEPYFWNEEGAFNGELAQNLWVQEIHAEFGDIGGWQIGSTQITSDSGNVFLDSSVPSLGIGATGYQTGTGIWMGKAGGAYKLSIGDASSKQMYWDGSALTAGGFTVGADYIKDVGDSFGLASTVTGGDDVRFWAGATFASRATAPLQLYESGYIFAKDIVLAKGSLSGASGATGYGYAVDPLFLCHYDGALPYYSDFRGSAIGHKGQVDTRTGGVIFRRGIYNKAVQVAEAVTNKVQNPSAETTGNFVLRGTATVTRDTGTHFIGGIATATSYKIVLAAANDGIDLTTSALANAVHYVTFFVTGSALTTNQVSLDGTNWNATTLLAQETDSAGNTWSRYGVSILAAQANGSTTCRIRNTASSGTFYMDAVQVEQRAYPTPYCDGSLGGSTDTTVVNGHSWSGTAHASNGVRVAATIDYPPSGNINLAQGSISFWFKSHGVSDGFPVAFSAEVNSDNRLTILLSSSGNLKPYCDAVSGGSTVSTATGATTASTGWNHVAVTWTTGSLKLYLNGTLSGTTGTYVAPVGTLASLKVGYALTGFQCNTFLDDLAILPLVLTDHEVKSIYYSSAPLMLGISNQELRLSGAGLGDVFGNANGLFGRAADGTPSFGLLNGTVNASVWGGASETFDAGDYMFGSNASGKSNTIFDASSGLWALRTATTRKVSADTSGTVLIGSDVSSPTTTAFAVFSGSVTYNSESMQAGDILIGDNSSGQPNIRWRANSGFTFREGTTGAVSISGGGIVTSRAIGHAQTSVSVTSGNVDLDDGGHATSGVIQTSYIRISSSTGTFTIRGIAMPGISGQRLVIHNNSANDMVLKNNGTPGAGYDKIITFGGDVTCAGDGICELIYNDTSTRWDLLSVGRGWT